MWYCLGCSLIAEFSSPSLWWVFWVVVVVSSLWESVYVAFVLYLFSLFSCWVLLVLLICTLTTVISFYIFIYPFAIKKMWLIIQIGSFKKGQLFFFTKVSYIRDKNCRRILFYFLVKQWFSRLKLHLRMKKLRILNSNFKHQLIWH
jgi:hypothetical protein